MKSLRILFGVLGIYFAVALLTILASRGFTADTVATSYLQPVDATVSNLLLFSLVFVATTFVLVRSRRVSTVFLPVALALVLAAGAQSIFSIWFSSTTSIVLALGMYVLMRLIPVVLIHTIAMMIGLAGIVAILGTTLSPIFVCGALALFSVYDIVAVYRTQHMGAVAGRMLESGSVFGFLVPSRLNGYLQQQNSVLASRDTLFLGSGDVGLPMLLVASLARQSTTIAVIVACSIAAGAIVMQVLFMRQKDHQPMAALPPIAGAALVGYLYAVLAGL